MKEGPNPKKARSRFVCYSSFVIRIASLYRLGPRFLIEHSHSLCIGGPGFFMGIANGGQPGSPELTQRAHHVEYHAGLPLLIEVEVMTHHDVEKIVRSKCAIQGVTRRDRWRYFQTGVELTAALLCQVRAIVFSPLRIRA